MVLRIINLKGNESKAPSGLFLPESAVVEQKVHKYWSFKADN